MAFRKRTFRKRTVRKRTFRRGRRTFRRIRRPLTQKTVYTYTRLYKLGTITSSTVADLNFAHSFALSDLPSLTDFSTLYDQYMITGIKATFIPSVSSVGLPGNCGNIVMINDYDDSVAPTFAGLMEKQGVRFRRPTSMFKQWIPCRPLTVTYYNGVSYGYQTKNTPIWLDMQNASIPHYGLKWVWTTTSAAVLMDVYFKFYFKCRGVQ